MRHDKKMQLSTAYGEAWDSNPRDAQQTVNNFDSREWILSREHSFRNEALHRIRDCFERHPAASDSVSALIRDLARLPLTTDSRFWPKA
jgi:hypothetical protein